MPELTHSSFLDFQAHRLTDASTVAQAYGFDPSAAQTPPAGPTVIVALVLDRISDPTTLLNETWGGRQQALADLQASGTLWTTYGASQADYDALVGTLQGDGITTLGAADNYIGSAESGTIWMQLNPTQFQEYSSPDHAVYA